MTKTHHPAWLLRLFPVLRWKNRVTPQTIKSDLMSGLTVAIVVVPQAVAFASIAGMPPQYGLYAGMIPPIIAAFFGSSWHLMSGPTTAASIVLLSSLSVFAEPMTPHYVSLALTLTFMVGVIELGLGLARMGTLVNFISHSVVVGFTTGAAILIASKQLKNFFGVPIPREGNLFTTLGHFWHQLPNTNGYILAIALVTFLSGMAVKRLIPRIPFLIVALLAGSFLGVMLNLIFGGDVTHIKTVGALPQTLPPLSMPDFSLQTIKDLAPAALAMTLFALTEAVSIGRALGIRSGQLIDGNQEFIGQGLSNIAGSFFSGYVATGSFNRSGLNYEAGAKTPLAAVMAGVLLMGIVLLVAPLAAYLPNAAMAGVLLLVAWGLIDIHHIKKILRASRAEATVMSVTFLAALFLDLEFAILLGVGLSLMAYLNRTSRPNLRERVPDPSLPKRRFNDASRLPQCPQLRMVRIDGSLFFGAVSHVSERLREMEKKDRVKRNLALIGSSMNLIDVAGAEMLVQEAQRLRNDGRCLYLFRFKPVVLQVLERGGYLDEIGRDCVFDSKGTGLKAVVGQMDESRCASCTARVFAECPAACASEETQAAIPVPG
ncbi:MAG: SulP family inorganic anion transporter [Candidatus Thiodiazotropha sp.]